MLLFLIRHGDPIYEPDSLTPLGKKQAEALAKRLALYGIDRVFTSTSNRAIETAIPICEWLGIKPVELDFCNESHGWRDFSIVRDGKRYWVFSDAECKELFVSNEVRKLDKKWYEHPGFADTRCKEGMEFINSETDKFFADLGYIHDRENNVFHCEKPNDERIALFAHGGFTLSFLSSVLDIPYPMICTHFTVNQSSMTVIRFDNNETLMPRVLTYSNDSHLYREGLPTTDSQYHYF